LTPRKASLPFLQNVKLYESTECCVLLYKGAKIHYVFNLSPRLVEGVEGVESRHSTTSPKPTPFTFLGKASVDSLTTVVNIPTMLANDSPLF